MDFGTAGVVSGAEWSIQDLSRRAGVSSRTLRHYDAVGLLAPSRVAQDGRRHYDADAVARLQQILVLRGLGLSLVEIGELLASPGSEAEHLRRLVERLTAERDRLEVLIRAVRHTLDARRHGTDPSMEKMMEGFNAEYKDEVIDRWGEDAWRRSADWWESKTFAEQAELRRRSDDLIARWKEAADAGEDPRGSRGRALAAEHVDWLGGMPGTPMESDDPAARAEYVRCLAHMYVDDARFVETYGGRESAEFVHDALLAHLEG